MSLPEPYYDAHGVTLYLGDSFELLGAMRANSIDCVVTSPPYNQFIDRLSGGGMHKRLAESFAARSYPDALNEREYQGQQLRMLDELGRLIRPTGSVFYNHKPRWRDGVMIHPLDWVGRCRLKLRQEIVWAKNGAIALNARMFGPSDERVYWLVDPSGRHKWDQSQVGHLTVWKLCKVGGHAKHACPFPEEIPRRAIAATTDVGDVVLDPYAGTGTTIAVAMRMGRRAIGVERDERFAEAAAERVEAGAAGQ